MDKILTCIYCDEQFNNLAKLPMMLIGCGHSICKECLLDFIQKKENFKCIEDNQVIITKNKTLESFPINHELNKIIMSQKNSIKIDESFSDEDFGQDFDTPMSSEQEQHEKKHLNITNKKQDVNKDQVCNQHNKLFEVYCLDCCQKCCYSCALFGNHVGHDIKTKDDVVREIEQETEELEEMKDQLTTQNLLSNQKNQTESIFEKIIQKKKQLINQLDIDIEDQIKVIKLQKEILISKIITKFDSLLNSFDNEKLANNGKEQESTQQIQKNIQDYIDKLTSQTHSMQIDQQMDLLKEIQKFDFKTKIEKTIRSKERESYLKNCDIDLDKDIVYEFIPIRHLQFKFQIANVNDTKEQNDFQKAKSQFELKKLDFTQLHCPLPKSNQKIDSSRKNMEDKNDSHLIQYEENEISNKKLKKSVHNISSIRNINFKHSKMTPLSYKTQEDSKKTKNDLTKIIPQKERKFIDKNRQQRVSYQPSISSQHQILKQNQNNKSERAITPKVVKIGPRTSEYSISNKVSLKNIDDSSGVNKKIQRSLYVPKTSTNQPFIQISDQMKKKSFNRQHSGVSSMIMRQSHVQIIDKQNQALQDIDVENIIYQIGHSEVQELNFANNNLTLKSLKQLFKFIQRNKSIKVINVENNDLDQVNKLKISKEFEKKGVVLIV